MEFVKIPVSISFSLRRLSRLFSFPSKIMYGDCKNTLSRALERSCSKTYPTFGSFAPVCISLWKKVMRLAAYVADS